MSNEKVSGKERESKRDLPGQSPELSIAIVSHGTRLIISGTGSGNKID